MILQALQDLFGRLVEGRSPRWPAARKAWLATHPTCAACGGKDNLNVHHLVPVHLDRSRELDRTNFLVLCEASTRLCHWRIGHAFSWLAHVPTAVEDAALSLKRIEGRVYKG